MKVYNRTFLPQEIEYRGSIYRVDMERTEFYKTSSVHTLNDFKGCIRVNVLANNLRHRENIHGKPYQPTVWIFSKVQQ